MRKILLPLLLITLLQSCGTPDKQQPNNNTPTSPADLLGPITIADLQKPPFNEWFESGYQSYKPDTSITAKINFKETEIVVFMGTWCSDSQREVPHLFKLLDETGFPNEKIKIIAVDEDKTQPETSIKEWGIEYVPTIILLKNGEEIGRIIESPNATLEKDLAAILNEPEKE